MAGRRTLPRVMLLLVPLGRIGHILGMKRDLPTNHPLPNECVGVGEVHTRAAMRGPAVGCALNDDIPHPVRRRGSRLESITQKHKVTGTNPKRIVKGAKFLVAHRRGPDSYHLYIEVGATELEHRPGPSPMSGPRSLPSLDPLSPGLCFPPCGVLEGEVDDGATPEDRASHGEDSNDPL